VIDNLWREHIDHLDVMRSGITWRGMAQRDPLVEYKREAYGAFDRFKDEVEHNVAELALRAPVQITLAEPPQASQLPRTHTNADDLAAASGQALGGLPQPRSRVSPAIAQAIAAASGSAIPQPPSDANGNATPHGANGANGNGHAPANDKAAANGATNGRQGQPGGQRGGQPGKGQRPGGGPNRPGGRAPVMSGAAASGAQKKPGRNDPCYCGSGKKYKVCHGR
jgi:preprotein translocase subunit SecA